MKLDTHADKVLYVWDYFYLAQTPATGDEAVWGKLERATCRIRVADSNAHASRPPDMRLRGARRMRASARLALRQIACLSVPPAQWVTDALVDIEAVADALISELSESAARVVVH